MNIDLNFLIKIKKHPKNAARISKHILQNALTSHTQFSSVAQSCPTLCDRMNRSTPGLPIHHLLLEFTQTLVH